MDSLHWITTNHIAHRGLHNKDFPENSMEAFLHAVQHNYDFELDLQLTKDNQIVVFHDQNLMRLCGIDKRISHMLYKDLKDVSISSTKSTIPLFKDVLDSIPSSTHLMIELKTSMKNRKLVKRFLSLMSHYTFSYVVQSFDPRIVSLLRKKAPNIVRGYITKNRQVSNILLNGFIKILPIHFWCKPNYYVYKLEDLPNKLMDKMKAKGYPILSYTARTKTELAFIKEHYDNAVFEGFLP